MTAPFPSRGRLCSLPAVGAAVLVAGVALSSSCPKPPRAADADAGVAVDADPVFPVEPGTDPVAAVLARMAPRSGACAQVRSIQDKAEADAVAAAIRKETGLPVEVLAADLGARGVWHRLCVGDEESPARLVARATRWTAPGGTLERFLDPPVGDAPRFLVHARAAKDPRTPTPAQATALLRRSPPSTVPGAAAPPVAFAGTFERPLLVTSGPLPPADSDPSPRSRVIVVDVDGRVLPLDPAPPPGCASCALAEQKSPVVARRLSATGDVLPAPGAEILVEEETRDGTRFLAVLVDDDGTLRRRGAVLLAQSTPGVTLRGEASVVEGDGDDDREVAIGRIELRFDGGNLCSLTTHAEIWTTDEDAARGLTRIDPHTLAARADGDDAVVDFITAIDGAGDRDAGSRACARILAERPGTLVMQLCLQRTRALVAEGRLVEAVNAAGALAEASPALRAAVAGPFFAAMSALDADPRLSAAPWDCANSPLVAGASDKPLDEVLRQARVRAAERIGLADVADVVFVTAARDFGADTPVGQIAARWLERLRVAQPARHAAIEALLLPPAPEPVVPPTDAGIASDGPAFGGGP